MQVSGAGLSEGISLSYFIHIQCINVARVHVKSDRDNLRVSGQTALVFKHSSFPLPLPFSESGILLGKELRFTTQGRRSNRELARRERKNFYRIDAIPS